MSNKRRMCISCGNEFSDESPMCPHCARPALYVNVHRAEDDEERKKLQSRYDAAIVGSRSRGCESVLRDFERASRMSTAVLARKGFAFEALLDSDSRIYSTFYKECLAGIRLPEGSDWDELRDIADTKLFGQAKANIRFAALTVDEFGATGYGDFHLHLRENMIAHRATVFHTNSALFPERFVGVMPSTGLPLGFRATWMDRHLLCVAKLASQITSGTESQEYGRIMLASSRDPRAEEFIEVHIWGPITIRAVDFVVVRRHILGRTGTGARRKKLERALTRYGADLKVI